MSQKLEILKMIEAGEISVEKGLELLEAADQTEKIEEDLMRKERPPVYERYGDQGEEMDIKVSLINSKLNVERSNVNEVTVELYDNRTRELIHQPEWLEIREEKQTLYIKETKKGTIINLFDIFKPDKESVGTAFINVKLPKNTFLSNCKIQSISGSIGLIGLKGDAISATTVSGKVHVADILCEELKLKSTSGSVIGEHVQSKVADFGSTSGKVKISGENETLRLKSVSGSIHYVGNEQLKALTGGTVSGKVTVIVPTPEQYNLDISSLSGRVDTSGFAPVDRDMSGKRRVLVENRSKENQIKLSSVSGSILLDRMTKE